MQKIKDFLAFECRLSVYCIGVILGTYAICSTRVWDMWIVLLNGSPMALFVVGFIEAAILWSSLGCLFRFVLKQANQQLDNKGR